MTQFGKCDICRRRKVKCDEERPSCGQCRKKNRPCGYEYAKTSRFADEIDEEMSLNSTDLALCHRDGDPIFDEPINKDPTSKSRTLIIRSVKEAKEGRGVFHTFNTVAKPGRRIRARDPSSKSRSVHLPADVPRPLVSRDMYLSFELIELLGEEALQWDTTFLWGCWISQVPGRLGRNAALDDAADLFIAGHAVLYGEEPNIASAEAVANAKYTTALGSLQKALYARDEVRYSTETLAAVNLLLLYDEIHAFRELRWQAHSKGLVQLLFARGPQCMTEDMSRSLFYAALTHDFSEAVLHGRVSVFDSEEWLNFPPPQKQWNSCMDFTGSDEITRHFIQLPRLITLVRQVREEPFNVDASDEAVALAEYLYSSYLDIIAPRVDAAFSSGCVEWVGTIDRNLARYYPESLTFRRFNDFEASVRYFFVRVLVLKLCMELRVILPFSRVLNTANLEEEEERCIMLIVASVQYAETQEPVSMGALIVQLPMQVAYGSWWRKRSCTDQNKSWEAERAVFMEQWCYLKTNAFVEVLNGDIISESKLQAMYISAAEAGPFMMGCKRQASSTEMN